MKRTNIFLLSLSFFSSSCAASSAHELHQQGIAYRDKQEFKKAIACLKQATEKEEKPSYYFDLAYTYVMIGKTEKAVALQKKIIDIWPYTRAQLFYNIAYAYKMAGKMDDAITYYKKTLELKPDHRPTHFGIALAYLGNGEYEKGWEHYTVHLQGLNRNAEALRKLIKNNNLYAKRIVLRAEGGLGDTINFIRWAFWFKQYGAHVIASVQDPLFPLLSHCYFIDELISWKKPTPPHDAQVTLISANCVCNANEKTIPAIFPYIFPDAHLDSYWQDQLQKDTNVKVGLCWQASVFNDSSRLPVGRRGIPLQKVLSLCSIPGTTFYSLQKCDGMEELTSACLPDNFVLFENLDATSPFADSAALINNLDLVITIDSAIAHLAGALGKKVWLLLPYQSDWRWLANRTDSIWYPSMTLYKQPAPFDWDSVILDVQSSLERLALRS